MKPYVRYLFAAGLGAFASSRFLVRPWILSHQSPPALVAAVGAFPNLVEAVFGTFIVAMLGMSAKRRLGARGASLPDAHVYLAATLIAGAYVLLQELGVHRLGGSNTYDPYDVVASIAGLAIGYGTLNLFGLVERAGPRGNTLR